MSQHTFSNPISRTFHTGRRTKGVTAIAVVALSAWLFTGCSNSVGNNTTEQTQTEHLTEENHGNFMLLDGWAKAAKQGDMTSVFGTLDNGTDTDMHITGVRSTLSSEVELHETYLEDGATKMREVKGGFVIPAHDTLELEPGGNHFMLMNLHEDLLAGDQLALEVELADGTVEQFSAEIRDFAGASEDYGNGHEGNDEHASHGE